MHIPVNLFAFVPWYFILLVSNLLMFIANIIYVRTIHRELLFRDGHEKDVRRHYKHLNRATLTTRAMNHSLLGVCALLLFLVTLIFGSIR